MTERKERNQYAFASDMVFLVDSMPKIKRYPAASTERSLSMAHRKLLLCVIFLEL